MCFCVSAPVHVCGWHHARIFVCSYSVSVISRKCIQLIAFTYWPEPPLRGGITADWVCRKIGWEEEKKKEREKERKWKHVCEKTHQCVKMGIVHVLNPSLWLVAFDLKGQQKLNSHSPKFGGFTGMNTLNHTEGPAIWYSVSPKWIFPSGCDDKIRLRNGFLFPCRRLFSGEASLMRYRLLTLPPYKMVSPSAQLVLKLIKEQ